ncbi:putative aldouronate transport system permease protein [Lachnospiraceae bacterium NLAE-zl-G231]|nr:putative aldouronate transport system permease protein [Lachnospiraceae bacterium NLAE-zl-G231]
MSKQKTPYKMAAASKSSPALRKFRQDIPLYILALPGVIALLLFSYFPMAGIVLVFKDYNFRGGIFGSPWADPITKNFRFFFNNISTAMRSTGLTVMYNLLFFIIGTIFAVAIAIMLSEIKGKFFIKISQSLMFLPYFISWMVMGAILYAMLNVDSGLVNQILISIGKEPIDFYAKPKTWIAILTIVNTWQSCGYTSIIYYGVLTGIDSSLYEAAKVDGATKLQCIRKITIPLLRPTIIILFLLSIGNMLKGNLNMIIGLTNLNPVLFPTTDLIDVFVYRSGVRNGEMAFASAISLYQSIFGFLLVITANKIAGKFDKDSTLF